MAFAGPISQGPRLVRGKEYDPSLHDGGCQCAKTAALAARLARIAGTEQGHCPSDLVRQQHKNRTVSGATRPRISRCTSERAGPSPGATKINLCTSRAVRGRGGSFKQVVPNIGTTQGETCRIDSHFSLTPTHRSKATEKEIFQQTTPPSKVDVLPGDQGCATPLDVTSIKALKPRNFFKGHIQKRKSVSCWRRWAQHTDSRSSSGRQRWQNYLST